MPQPLRRHHDAFGVPVTDQIVNSNGQISKSPVFLLRKQT